MKKLNFGCGEKKFEGFVNADYSNADVNFDFDKFPYPFKDNTFDYVYTRSVLEHLENPIKVMEELHRICKNGATIEIVSPFWLTPSSSSIAHKHSGISADWLNPIVDNHLGEKRYRAIKGKFDLIRYEYVPNFKFMPKFLVNKFANVIPCLVLLVKHYLLVKK